MKQRLDTMNSSGVVPLPANFAFCTLISPFLASLAVAMQSKNDFITAQKPSFSVPSNNPIRVLYIKLKGQPKNITEHDTPTLGIENKLHWVLGIAFSEDASRKRTGNAAQNFSLLSKIALNLPGKDKQTR